MCRPVTVLKLGGSVLASPASLPAAVHEIYREWREARSVVAVVSALGGVTDTLAERARGILPEPSPGALAALLATGELEAAALLTLALERAGVPARVVDVEEIGLVAEGPALDAEPVSVDARRLRGALAGVPVVVVPGFVARDAGGRRVVLGRGGSDLTALALGAALDGARVRLVKDVPGLFDRDPARIGGAPRLYASLTWDGALALSERIVQHKAVRFARERGLEFEVAGLNGVHATHVGAGGARFADPPYAAPRPMRVAVSGLGTVGLGVWRHLASAPAIFDPVRAVVRRVRPCIDAGVEPARLTVDPSTLLAPDVDVVVDALTGEEASAALVAAALAAGKHVVTANKFALARRGRALRTEAERRGVRLAWSAAVGGAVPVLESIRALREEGEIVSIEAVLNGTTSFVLDRLAEGEDLAGAVRAAQALGFAEADPRLDLDGTDAATKLVLAASAAWDVEIDVADVATRGIGSLGPADVVRAASRGLRPRLLARLARTSHGVRASVRPEPLAAGHPLSALRGEENGVVVSLSGRAPVVLTGKGAGRYPTAEAVIGDLLEIARAERLGARDLAPRESEREEVA